LAFDNPAFDVCSGHLQATAARRLRSACHSGAGGQGLAQPGELLLSDLYPTLTLWCLTALLECATDAGLIEAGVVTILASRAEQ
jgi:hypothetical protein